MTIIVEGMDNTGKTHLVQHLASKFKLCKGATYLKPSSLESIIQYDRWLNQCPQNLIMDRHPYISELVYGGVLGRAPILTERHTQVWSEGHLIIHCRPSVRRILDFGDREQMEGVIDSAAKLIIMYDCVMETLTHHVYNWNNLKEIENAVAEYIQKTA